MNNDIIIENVSKSFGSKEIFSNITLSIQQGCIFGLVGLNGAGKTSLIRLLLGLLKPDTGRCTVLNQNPWNHEVSLFRSLGVVLEHTGFYSNLTPRANLYFFGEAKGISKTEVDEYLSKCWSHTSLFSEDKKVKFLSRGQKIQCGLCRAFLGKPKLFFLDEPLVALDLEAQDHFFGLVKYAQSYGATFVISSHQLEAVEKQCTQVGMLEAKNLRIIHETSVATPVTKWFIRADFHPGLLDLITQTIGGAVEYQQDSYWFDVQKDPSTIISHLIHTIVTAGYSLFEVTYQRDVLAQSIRQTFVSRA